MLKMKFSVPKLTGCIGVIMGFVACAGALAAPAHERFEFKSYVDVAALFEKLNYTPEAWQKGVRAVPRVYLSYVPPRWRDSVAPNISVQTKKRIFFRTLAPLVLRANELILEDRKHLIRIKEDRSPSQRDNTWLHSLAQRYKVGGDAPTPLSSADLRELLARVDTVPTSLVLAQAAEESGWGTSRFAALGNALFGQWTWGDEGIRPEQQRESLGDHKIAAFESPQDSILAYVHNLNTHRAYAALRQRRAALRAEGKPVTGAALVGTLTAYSERGEGYVKSLRAIMRINKLAPADDAYLVDMAPIDLVPVGEGAGTSRD